MLHKLKPAFLLTVVALIVTGCTNSTTSGATFGYTNSSITSSTNMNAAKVDMYKSAPAELPANELQGKTAIIKTNKGDITIQLRGDKAPKTVSNFIFLAQNKFYDGLTFHRRVEGFVIQGGDPAGNGTGGPGYNVPAEITDLKHIRGAVATARTGDEVNPTRESSGSQFYIALDDIHQLDGDYTIFGYVTEGMEVADKIQVGDVINTIVIQ